MTKHLAIRQSTPKAMSVKQGSSLPEAVCIHVSEVVLSMKFLSKRYAEIWRTSCVVEQCSALRF